MTATRGPYLLVNQPVSMTPTTLGNVLDVNILSVGTGANQDPSDLTVFQSFTGVQPTANTPVAGGTIVLALGTGQTTFDADLLGTFTAGSSVVFEGSPFPSLSTTEWVTIPVDIFGGANGALVVNGTGSSQYVAGRCASWAQIRARLSAQAGGDAITLAMRAGTGDSGNVSAKLMDGEKHVGEVGGNSEQLESTLTVSTSAYSAGNCVGGLITLTGALRVVNGRVIVQSVLVSDFSNQKAPLDILIFKSQPAATFTDHAAFPTLSRADGRLIKRRISIAASDYVTVGGTATADIGAISKVIKGANGDTGLFMAINTSGTPTYANAGDLTVSIGLLRD